MTSEDQDRKWNEGYRAAWVRVLETALGNLGVDGPMKQHAAWISEREAVVRELRALCETFGDNDWPDNLHLGDVIEKHLARYLDAETKEEADAQTMRHALERIRKYATDTESIKNTERGRDLRHIEQIAERALFQDGPT